jgi:hypothetical protein
MPTMTQPWLQIVARYDAFEGEHKSIRALGALAQRPRERRKRVKRSMGSTCSVFAMATNSTPSQRRLPNRPGI